MSATLSSEKDRVSAARRVRRTLANLEESTGETGLVGVAEAAEFLGVAKSKIWALLAAGRMPAPVGELTCGKVWVREELRPLRDELEAGRARRNGQG